MTGKQQPAGSTEQTAKKLSIEEFTLLAIEKLKRPPYEGIHSVYSGFNQAFRDYFDGLDPVVETLKLAAEGKIHTQLVKGGVMIFPGPRRESTPRSKAESTLKKMGLV